MEGNGKIEKGVPLPPGKSSTKYTYLRDMKVGDSTLISSRRSASNAGTLYFGIGNYAVRKEGDKYRLWRTG